MVEPAKARYRVLIVGVGKMGISHAKAYAEMDNCEFVGVCSRSIMSKTDLPAMFDGVTRYADYDEALRDSRPDIVVISTLPDTHAPYAIKAMQQGAHVFLEKPLAETMEDARLLLDTAHQTGRKLVIGHILRHHPSWRKFAELTQQLGKPLVMRMNLNQQSLGPKWASGMRKLRTMSPIVDCGVHYVDYMLLMTGARPVAVHAIGANLTDEIAQSMYNYGQLQVSFDDGSVGWYEAAWGPMISETAHFIKDVVGPRGSVSMVPNADGVKLRSDDINGHTKANRLLVHHWENDANGDPVGRDEFVDNFDEPGHDALCALEQQFLIDAIRTDADLTEMNEAAAESLRIVLAADESVRTHSIVRLD